MAPALLLALLLAASQSGEPGVPVSDSIIREIVAEVSADSIRATIQALQSFVTRYSYAPGCSLAGDYVRERFDEAGLETEFHRYQVPALAADLCVLSDGGRGWMVDTLGTALYTNDGGESWVEQLGLDYHHLFGLCFPDSTHGWASGSAVFSGSAVILHTSDGGANWAVQTSFPEARLNKVVFLNRDRGWACGSSRDSAFVVRTTDRGRTWSARTLGVPGELRDLCFTDNSRGWAVGGEPFPPGAVVLRSGDGGVSWEVQLRTEGWFNAVWFADSLTGWAAGADSAGRPVVLRTTSGGSNWSPCSPDSGFQFWDVAFLDHNHGWCVGDSGVVCYTTDAGNSWTGWQLGRRALRTLRIVDSLTVWAAGERDTVLITTDLGASWDGRSPRGSYVWRNVLGTIRGGSAPDTIWMASAHYDCYSTRPWQAAPGADDDASGVAALIEAARVLGRRRFASSIVLAAFSGEEQNFIGSSGYVEHILPMQPAIAGLLNLDMIGFRDTGWAVNVVADSVSEPLADSLGAFAGRYVPGLSVRKVVDPAMRYWDSNAFWDAGYRAVSVVEREFNPAYHTPGDTLGVLTLRYAADVTKAAIATLACSARCLPQGMEESSTSYALPDALQVEPNPFSLPVAIRYSLSAGCRVSLVVHDLTGRAVRTLVASSVKPGAHSVAWNGTDDAGRSVAAGIYFCRFSAGDTRQTQKLVLQR